MDESQSKIIDISQLRKGMFVQLDMGWMSHPFAAGSFKVATEEQIHTIRSLGVSELRYFPDRSDPGMELPLAAGAGMPFAKQTEATLAAQQRLQQLDLQRSSLQACEQQFTEAVRVYQSVADRSASQPATALADAAALAASCTQQLLSSGDSVVRLLPSVPGERQAIHSVNVMVLSMLLARALAMDAKGVQEIGVAALLHDLGKLALPQRVRSLDRHFAPEEILAYQSHVSYSIAAGERMGMSADALRGIAQHHEMVDGSGFPLGLSGQAISLQGKILALVNRYDNLCNPPFEGSVVLTPHEALSVIFAQMKSRFDSAVLGAFIRMMGVYPPGSVVQLVNDRFAMVVSVNPSRPLRPQIIVHDPRVPRDEALILDLETTPGLGIRCSIKSAQLPVAVKEYLQPPARVCCFFERTA